MSNKSRLHTNNTNLQTLIDKANALPEASGSSGGGSGGSGSGSIETCTLTVMAAAPCYVVYVTSDDTGNIHTEVTSMSAWHSELPVLCGGHISIIGNTTMATAGDVSVNGAELILQKNWSSIFRITAAVGGSASISIMINT